MTIDECDDGNDNEMKVQQIHFNQLFADEILLTTQL